MNRILLMNANKYLKQYNSFNTLFINPSNILLAIKVINKIENTF
jgi:hypothetical protein